MVAGNIVLGLGIGIFKLSGMGNDSSSAMVIAIAETVGLPFSVTSIIFNFFCFLVEIFLGKGMIGIGTFFNWGLVGVFADLLVYSVTYLLGVPQTFVYRLVVMLVGVVVLSIGCSLYQTADMGISPYDSLALIISKRLKLPYFWSRIATDSSCVAVALALHGLIGPGTLICTFGLGPFVSFFNRTLSKRIVEGSAWN